MLDISSNNKRIAKNTILLYFRMLVTMAVTLSTSREVLAALGVEDYGIYNVVGGVVALFSFINSAMSTSTQRFLVFELGKGDFRQLQKVFSISVVIHIIIAIVIVLLSETIGLWLLNEKMVIPESRVFAAHWVYHVSILSMVVAIISVPYNAAIIAHEKMSIFAYISVVEVFLKLVIVYLLRIGNVNKLVLYAILLFVVQVGIRILYTSYCNKHFCETKFKFILDKTLFKEMFSFAAWNLWGNCAYIAFTQGLNILLNVFFGPSVNAARGVAVQVQSAVTQFSSNFQTALNPQITKSYATEDLDYMHSLVFRSSRFTFFLLLMLTLPIALETETILSIWLEEVPRYSAVFLKLILCVTIIDSVANPLMVSATATGKVKVYQSVIGGILLMILPVSYVVLKMGGNPASVFVVHLVICAIAFVVRLFIIRPLIKISLRKYFSNVILKCAVVFFLSFIISVLVKFFVPYSSTSFVIVGVMSVCCVVCFAYALGLNKSERNFINEKLVRVFSRKK